MKRIVLGVQYDGSPWRGWQTQPCGNTVQDRLQAALKCFSLAEIVTTCAGRTDAGVHALEQIVHFDTELVRDSNSWVRGINSFLPPSIAVRWAGEVPWNNSDDFASEFHARFSACARTYHYVLYSNPIRSPLLNTKAGWIFSPLDIDKMQMAARLLLGSHDFSAFRASGCQAKSPVKTMHEIRVVRDKDLVIFTFRANAFLHHMVRNIVGSLIQVGKGKRYPEWLAEVLSGRDRSQAAPTFMPDGLYLAKIDYPERWNLPREASGASPWL